MFNKMTKTNKRNKGLIERLYTAKVTPNYLKHITFDLVSYTIFYTYREIVFIMVFEGFQYYAF